MRWLAGLMLAGLLAAMATGCSRHESEGGPLRLGYFPNITHAQALVGARDGTFQRALGSTPLELKRFNAGPPAMEALMAGDIDLTYVGPSPAVLAYVRSGGKVHVISGAVSGGAALVVKDSPSSPRDFIGKRLAAPQIGNSQDVSLRFWLKQQGIDASDKPGREVAVLPLSSSDILALFKRGELAAAWVPEPWVSRLVTEAGGKILLDERTLWPDGEFPTTVLVVTEQALTQRRREVEAVVRAHEELTLRYAKDPAAFQAQVNEAFAEITQKKLPPAVLEQAFSRLDLTTHTMQPQLDETARRLVGLGYLPHADVGGLVDGSLLAGPSE